MNKSPLDILWILTATALVFVMQAGFLCLEAGLTRRKNSINVAIKNVADFGISMLLFWMFGFGLMFGVTQAGWIGTSQFLVDLSAGDPWLAAFFLFQVVFCGTAVTIVSGAIAERVRFAGYLLMSVVISAVIYPMLGHWAWGGAWQGEPGWLARMGFVDFAGSTVVHSVGGWASLATLLIIGPRTDKYPQGLPPREISGSNLSMAMMGTLLLWFAWIGFNGGSTLAFDDRVPLVIANTMLAASAGMVAASWLVYRISGFSHAMGPINGVIAGLVAITANCHAVLPWQAVLIGAVGGMLSVAAYHLLEHWHIDDAVSAVPCHLVAGMWGTLAVGLLGDLKLLDTGLTRWQQIGVQALGVGVCGLWAGGIGYGLLWLLNRCYPLRVTPQAERIGLNVVEHHAANDLHDFIKVIEQQSQTRDLSLRAPVEPFTEVGQVAEHYNDLMSVLEQSKADIDELETTQSALEVAVQKAQAADRAKSEFLANMSHEIRTPLHGILSFAGLGLMKGQHSKPERILNYFQKIDISGQCLLRLVNALLDLAKLEAGRMTFEIKDNDIVPMVRNVTDEFTSLLSEHDIKINFHSNHEILHGPVDDAKIMQVVRNLLSNAVKFSPANSTIEVSLVQDQDRVRLEVRDHGEGIPADELEAVFDKFVQSSKTKNGAGGTGLGLAICREIIAGHHGRIWAQNHPNGGAIFTVELPLHPTSMRTPCSVD